LSTIGRDALIRGGRVADLADHRISAVTDIAPVATHHPTGMPTVDGAMNGSAVLDQSTASLGGGRSPGALGLGAGFGSGAAAVNVTGGSAAVTSISGGTLAAGTTTAAAAAQGSMGQVRSGNLGPVGSTSAAGAGTRASMGVRRRRLEVVIEPLADDD
jgi:hypothetical protein